MERHLPNLWWVQLEEILHPELTEEIGHYPTDHASHPSQESGHRVFGNRSIPEGTHEFKSATSGYGFQGDADLITASTTIAT